MGEWNVFSQNDWRYTVNVACRLCAISSWLHQNKQTVFILENSLRGWYVYGLPWYHSTTNSIQCAIFELSVAVERVERKKRMLIFHTGKKTKGSSTPSQRFRLHIANHTQTHTHTHTVCTPSQADGSLPLPKSLRCHDNNTQDSFANPCVCVCGCECVWHMCKKKRYRGAQLRC